MSKYLIPLSIFSTLTSLVALLIFLLIPPTNPLQVVIFLIIIGLTLAGWLSIGIYFVRRFAGPKDSPRFLLRDSMRQALIAAGGLMLFLVIEVLGAGNLVTFIIVLLIVIVFERLT